MTVSQTIAKHLNDLHRGGNWTSVNLDDQLKELSWQQAITKIEGFHSIAALVYHINYFVAAQLSVMEGQALTAHDKFSFDHPDIQSEDDWQALIEACRADVDKLVTHLRAFPDEKLQDHFVQEKYGTNLRNFLGVVEHSHYHLGQIVILRRLVLRQKEA